MAPPAEDEGAAWAAALAAGSAAADQGFRRRTTEAEVPDARVVVDRLPALDAGQKGVHQDEPLDLRRELRGIGIGHHQPDVMADDPRFLDPE